jgi:mannose-6-phosphate isomerase-like protein (cupin superfamily)
VTFTPSPAVFQWDALAATEAAKGVRRATFLGDKSVVEFCWLDPDAPSPEPRRHAVDQISITIEGKQALEVNGRAIICEAGLVTRIPAGSVARRYTASREPALSIDIFAPLHPLGTRLDGDNDASGDPRTATSAFFAKLPRETLAGGLYERSAYRGDNSLVVFNTIDPDLVRPEPHHHPFDQIVLIAEGHAVFEVNGEQYQCPPRSIMRIPPNLPHTGWPVGRKTVLNIDVFAPMRADYAHLVAHQRAFDRS